MQEAADLLESAWPAWCRRFGVEPTLEQGPLRVRIFADRETYLEAIKRDTREYLPKSRGFCDFRKGRVYARYFPGENPPARAAVAVTGLPKDALVEIDCIAAVS